MKRMKRLRVTVLSFAAVIALSVCARAADYSFMTESPGDYYPSTSYGELYGTQYNYNGINLIDLQIPELEYGVVSTTQTGIMEKNRLPSLQPGAATSFEGEYGVASGEPVIMDIMVSDDYPVYGQPAYTSAADMERADGSIGTLEIPVLGIHMKVWEGETNASMQKGLGHYTSTSAWDGNVGVCGHNRGAKYVIGDIKNLKSGDKINYTTIYGTRTYEVSLVETISSSDWSHLQATLDNRITITTCLANHPDKRICVQAREAG